MQPIQRLIVWTLILTLGLVWIGISKDDSGTSTHGKIPAPQQGFLAPDFELLTLDGTAIRLSDLRGQAIVLNFWASWCLPCRAEMPDMEELFIEYKEQGFTILAVNTTVQDRRSDVEQFVAEHHLTFPILMDTDGRVNQAYLVRSLPTTFFIDKNGVIQEVVIGGPIAPALLKTRVQSLLEAKP